MIERAKGILMERHGVDEREAFELLREQARVDRARGRGRAGGGRRPRAAAAGAGASGSGTPATPRGP